MAERATSGYALAEKGPPIPYHPGRPTIALLNANPFAEGIANLGVQVIASWLLRREWNLEFAFADTCVPGRPFLAGLTKPADCTLLAVSVPFEDTYHHVPRMLRHCGVDPWAARRAEDDPIVVAGGMAMINPMPLSPFLDAVVIGEGRVALTAIGEKVRAGRARNAAREDILRELAAIPSVWVPSLYRIESGPDGAVESFGALDGAPERVHAARPLDLTEHPIDSTWTTARACYKYDDYYSVMVAMGCHLKCPFCVVGNVQGAASGRALNIERDTIVELARERRRVYGTNLVKLFFASSFSSQTSIDPLSLINLLDVMLAEGFECRVGSLNVRQADEQLLTMVKAAGQQRVTFAPETGASLRQSIGKPYSRDDKLVQVAELAGRHGLGLDLYTMLGVPGEEPRHVRELAGLIDRVRGALSGDQTLEVSLNPAFAKAQTPYERYASLRPEEARRRFGYLRSLLRADGPVHWVSVIDDPMAYYQPVLALGGAELAPVLAELSGSYSPSEAAWRRAVERHVPGGDRRYFTDRAATDRLPWEHIVFTEHRKLTVRLDGHRRRAAASV